jgi:hypothetical protein
MALSRLPPLPPPPRLQPPPQRAPTPATAPHLTGAHSLCNCISPVANTTTSHRWEVYMVRGLSSSSPSAEDSFVVGPSSSLASAAYRVHQVGLGLPRILDLDAMFVWCRGQQAPSYPRPQLSLSLVCAAHPYASSSHPDARSHTVVLRSAAAPEQGIGCTCPRPALHVCVVVYAMLCYAMCVNRAQVALAYTPKPP